MKEMNQKYIKSWSRNSSTRCRIAPSKLLVRKPPQVPKWHKLSPVLLAPSRTNKSLLLKTKHTLDIGHRKIQLKWIGSFFPADQCSYCHKMILKLGGRKVISDVTQSWTLCTIMPTFRKTCPGYGNGMIVPETSNHSSLVATGAECVW